MLAPSESWPSHLPPANPVENPFSRRINQPELVSERGIGYVSFGESDLSPDLYDAVLKCMDEGAWEWRAIEAPFRHEAGPPGFAPTCDAGATPRNTPSSRDAAPSPVDLPT